MLLKLIYGKAFILALIVIKNRHLNCALMAENDVNHYTEKEDTPRKMLALVRRGCQRRADHIVRTLS